MSQGLIILIPNPDKDCRYLDHFRPITLLNNDYDNDNDLKHFSKALTKIKGRNSIKLLDLLISYDLL